MNSMRATILANIQNDRKDIDQPLVVHRIEWWGEGKYRATPDHVGEIEVTYDRDGHRAIYGFRNDGSVTIYMD